MELVSDDNATEILFCQIRQLFLTESDVMFITVEAKCLQFPVWKLMLLNRRQLSEITFLQGEVTADVR